MDASALSGEAPVVFSWGSLVIGASKSLFRVEVGEAVSRGHLFIGQVQLPDPRRCWQPVDESPDTSRALSGFVCES
ncbi:hypothetical protein GCM10023096_18090 [Nonomuraea ferruginea]